MDQIISPKAVVRIPGEGMPYFTTRRDDVDDDVVKMRGDLFVQFEIKFPKTLTDDQRVRIGRILNQTE